MGEVSNSKIDHDSKKNETTETLPLASYLIRAGSILLPDNPLAEPLQPACPRHTAKHGLPLQKQRRRLGPFGRCLHVDVWRHFCVFSGHNGAANHHVAAEAELDHGNSSSDANEGQVRCLQATATIREGLVGMVALRVSS